MSKYVRTKAENIYFNTFLHYGYLFMNAINIVLGRECPGLREPDTELNGPILSVRTQAPRSYYSCDEK